METDGLMAKDLGIDMERNARLILETLHDAVYVVDRDRRIIYWNNAAERLSGYRRDEVVGRHCFDNILRHVDDQGNPLCLSACPLAQSMERGLPKESEVSLHHKAGHRIPVLTRVAPLRNGSGEVVGAVEVFSDNTVRRQLQERVRDLERMAMIDPLTGLPNRRYLESQLEAKLNELIRYDWPFGLLYIDIDHFKKINDARGHEAGDLALRAVAGTLSSSARVFDIVGRWGGDEFLVFVTNVDPRGLYEIGQRLRSLVASSLLPEPHAFQLTVSIGAAPARSGQTAEALLRLADACLYRAKREGKNRIVLAGAD